MKVGLTLTLARICVFAVVPQSAGCCRRFPDARAHGPDPWEPDLGMMLMLLPVLFLTLFVAGGGCGTWR